MSLAENENSSKDRNTNNSNSSKVRSIGHYSIGNHKKENSLVKELLEK